MHSPYNAWLNASATYIFTSQKCTEALSTIFSTDLAMEWTLPWKHERSRPGRNGRPFLPEATCIVQPAALVAQCHALSGRHFSISVHFGFGVSDGNTVSLPRGPGKAVMWAITLTYNYPAKMATLASFTVQRMVSSDYQRSAIMLTRLESSLSSLADQTSRCATSNMFQVWGRASIAYQQVLVSMAKSMFAA